MARATATRSGCAKQSPPRPRQPIRNSQRGRRDDREQFAAAQRAFEIYVLPLEIAAIIEPAGIAEISRRFRAHQRLHAISRASHRRVRRARLPVIVHAQPALHGEFIPVHLNVFEANFVTQSPRQAHRILAQASGPAQRFFGIDSPGVHQMTREIRGHRGAFQSRRSAAKAQPRSHHRQPCEPNAGAPPRERRGCHAEEHDRQHHEETRNELNREVCKYRAGEQDAAGERRDDRERW